ncbi:FAD-dependent oxidoreductase, partial [Burkholderia contaminans]|uniref:FAD-dependent oxidoreductase n=1 Tax=Burkholderia contaminans TaxID=488447 RepID=UPI002D80A136
MANVAIVGAGFIGLGAAAWLQRDGHRVTLFDPAGIGQGASFGNAATFAPYGLAASALQPCYGMAESTLAVSMHRAWHEGAVDGAPYVIADTLDRRALIERRDAQPAAANDGADTDTETVLAMGTPIEGMAF